MIDIYLLPELFCKTQVSFYGFLIAYCSSQMQYIYPRD